MISLCPCCQQPVENQLPFWVDVDMSALHVGGGSIHLPRAQAVLAHAMATKYPSAARKEYLLACLYGLDIDGGPLDAANVLSVQICNLRKTIKDSGVCIKTVWGVGWCLEMERV